MTLLTLTIIFIYLRIYMYVCMYTFIFYSVNKMQFINFKNLVKVLIALK